MRVCEFLAVGDGECLAATLDDFLAVLVNDVEGVAGEGPDFFFHDEGCLFGDAVGGEDAEGWIYWVEVDLCHCCGSWSGLFKVFVGYGEVKFEVKGVSRLEVYIVNVRTKTTITSAGRAKLYTKTSSCDSQLLYLQLQPKLKTEGLTAPWRPHSFHRWIIV